MRGNVVMKGYLKNKAATEKEFAGGWFHTGDLGVMHADGYIQLKDRSKDIIISGGENISSIEVEDALYKHPAVARRCRGGQARRQMGRDALRLRGTQAGRASRRRRVAAMVPQAPRRRTSVRATWCSRRSRRPARGRFRSSNCARWRRGCEAFLRGFSRPHAEESAKRSSRSMWPPSSFETGACGALLRMRAGRITPRFCANPGSWPSPSTNWNPS